MSAPVEFRYQPRYCVFLRKRVWAILTQQADGSWRTVNCLDKEESCYSQECAFTTDAGSWPYKVPLAAHPSDRPVG